MKKKLIEIEDKLEGIIKDVKGLNIYAKTSKQKTTDLVRSIKKLSRTYCDEIFNEDCVYELRKLQRKLKDKLVKFAVEVGYNSNDYSVEVARIFIIGRKIDAQILYDADHDDFEDIREINDALSD